MRRMTALLLGIVLGAVAVYCAFEFHVLNTAQGHLVVRKQRSTLADTYVDIRSWGSKEWDAHPALSASVVSGGHAEIVVRPTTGEFVRDFFRSFNPNPGGQAPNESR